MNKIKQARLNAGLTQKAMSERLNIPLRTIENWDAGQRTPPGWAESLIAEKLNQIKKENEKMKKREETASWEEIK